MSTSVNSKSITANDNFVVSDAIPDPPSIPFSSNPIIDSAEKIAQLNDSQNDELSKNEIPRASLDDSNNADPANNADAQHSTGSNTGTQKSNAKSRYKPKKLPKTRKPTTSTISFNIVNSTNVKVGPTVKNVFNVNNIQHHDSSSDSKCDSGSKEQKEMPSHIKALSENKLEITIEDMLLIKTHIGRGWTHVVKQIGYSKGQVEQFLENYKHSGEVVYQILLDWKQSCTKNATIGRLISEIWYSKEYECAEILAAAHA